jgi:hypothetical protein
MNNRKNITLNKIWMMKMISKTRMNLLPKIKREGGQQDRNK